MTRIQTPINILAILLFLASCEGSERPSPMCGLARLTGPLLVLEGVGRGDGLAAAPDQLPPIATGRFVGGPTAPVLLSRSSTGELIASVDASAPEQARPGFGVLVVDRSLSVLGILIHDGMSVRGATELGTIEVGDTLLPLIGARVTPTAIQTEDCLLFGAN